jgi:ADP-heptose:LPS heptosyltransferase
MNVKRILVISLSGIGNTILFTPFLNCLRSHYSEIEIDFLTLNQAMTEVVSGSNLANNIFVLSTPPFRILETLWQLRKKHYDYSVTAFPSNKWQFNVLAFLIGAKNRVTHKYKRCQLRTFLVGIHPGCNKENDYRRWPKEYFVELINDLVTQGRKILLFSGPDEIEETAWIYNNINDKDKIFFVKEKSLKNVGTLIARCKIFICTDSALGHIAAVLRVETLAIFGPAQASRTRPYGKYGHYIFLNLPCSPCLKYPFRSTSSKIKCKGNFECLKEIKVEDVIDKINKILK